MRHLPTQPRAPGAGTRVAILIPSVLHELGEVLQGIRDAARERRWELCLLQDIPITAETLVRMNVRGIVVHIIDTKLLASVRKFGIPMVCIHPGRGHGIPYIRIDQQALGRTAGAHLYERGCRKFAFFDAGDKPYSVPRLEGLRAFLRERGLEPLVFTVGPRTVRRGRWRLEDQLEDLAEFLGAHAGGLGLVTADDQHGERALEAIRIAGLKVPHDVAVVGTDNRENFCDLCDPPLSSVDNDNVRRGELAVQLLQRLMEGKQVPVETVLQPGGVVVRESSAAFAPRDPDVARAVAIVRARLAERVTVQGLADELAVSRRDLLRKFQGSLGRSPSEVVDAERIDLARALLRDTGLPLVEIARRSGLLPLSHFCRTFKRVTGETASAVRRRAKRGWGGGFGI